MSERVTFSIHTLGCKVNQYESERIAGELARLGWEAVDFSAKADVYIVNSCTVTAVASHKSRQLIRRAVRNNADATVVVTGCYADSDREEVAGIEGVDLVLGNADKDDMARLIAERLGVQFALQPALPGSNGDSADITAVALHTRSLIKVQDGCNQFCSYCIVPYVRGDLWSRPEEEIVDEVERLVASGTREVVLTGIHLGLYGAGEKTTLGGLLARLVEVPGLGRVRLSSIELHEITPQVAELMAATGKICNHLHIPLQSGSNDVLSRMNRHYTAEEFIERTGELKRVIDDLAITTDIIVGFPGETERDFEESVRVTKEVGFSKLHVFKFSPRKGTPAAEFDRQVPNKVKDERSASLIAVGERLSAAHAGRYVGKELSVLIERRQGEYLSGMSDNYIRVFCQGPDELIGALVRIAVERQEEATLYGRII